MYKLKAPDGSNNLCGTKLKYLRETAKMSQRQLAKQLQIKGYDLDNHFVRRVELGTRFVTDIELKIIADFFRVDVNYLLSK